MKRITVFLFSIALSLNLMAEDYLRLAISASEQGDYETVIEYTTQHLAVYPKDAQAYYYRALAYAIENEYGKALKDATNAVTYWDKKTKGLALADVYGLRAWIYEQVEDFEKALEDHNAAVKKDKSNVDSYTSRAAYYYRLDKYDLASEDYRVAMAMQPDSSVWKIEAARCLLALGDYAQADSLLTPVTKLEPRNEEARRLLAVACYYKDDKKAFVDNYLIYLDIADGGELSLLAMVAVEGEYEYVIRSIARLLATTQNKTYWYGVRARINRENRHYEEAISDLNRMELQYGDSIENPFVFYQMAQCYEGLYDFPKTIEYYNRLIEYLQKHDREADIYYINRATAYCNNGEFEKAYKDLDQAWQIATTATSRIHFVRGCCHEMEHKYKDAFEDFNKAINMNDGVSGIMYLFRGKYYLLYKNDTLRANADFEKVLTMDTIVQAQTCRHYALAYLGRYAEAESWMAQVIEAYPYPESYYDAACLYSRMSQEEKSIDYLTTAFNLGYRNMVHVARDNDLDAIRNRDDFKELLLQYQKEKVKSLLEQLTF